MERIRKLFSVDEANLLLPELERALDRLAALGKEITVLRREIFRRSLEEISRHGCIIRDLDMGLVDFYTVSKGQVVCLCWRRGEPRIEHWHPVNEGFSGRRPLDDLA